MDLYKKKAGGCSSMNYAGISDNYMLMDNALVKTGGKKIYKGGEANLKDIFGGGDDMLGGGRRSRRDDDLRRKGGNPFKSDDNLRRKGGNPLKNDDDLRRRGGNPPMQLPDSSMLGFGSAMKGFTDTLSTMTKTGGDPRKNDGGCGFASCNKKVAKRKGGTGIELAPFISSLVLLGLRAANDKSLQVGITKKLGSMVSESKKTKTKSKSKTKTLFD